MPKQKQTYHDDGHTIADMNVEGMPWYDREQRRERQASGARSPMSSTEGRAAMLAAVLSALAVAAVFGVVYFLFILLLDTAF